MQTFAIPGTIFLSLLAGSLYGVWRGSALVAGRTRLGGTIGVKTRRKLDGDLCPTHGQPVPCLTTLLPPHPTCLTTLLSVCPAHSLQRSAR